MILLVKLTLARWRTLGKTLIGCVWARSFQKTFENCKVIIICPVSLKQEWTRTAVEATELQVEAEEGKPKAKKKKSGKTKTSDGDHDDDVADGEEKEERSTPKVQIFSWAKVPTSIDKNVENYVVICDEAHSLQSMQAARTRELLTLVKPNRCVGVLLLTGTPMKNGRPSNLFPLLDENNKPKLIASRDICEKPDYIDNWITHNFYLYNSLSFIS